MKVILLKDIKGVGKRFEEKEVSNGYGMNFLIPKGAALVADKAGRAKAEQLKAQSETRRESENQRLDEKSAKREEKRLELEKFRLAQLSTKLESGRS